MWLKDSDRKDLASLKNPDEQPPNLYRRSEFRGEYLGGHPMLHQKVKVRLLLKDDTLIMVDKKSEALLLTFPYQRIIGIDNITSESVNAVAGVVFGIPFVWQWKNEKELLVIAFLHESGTRQAAVFKLDDPVAAYLDISDKVHTYQKLK